MSQDKNLNHLFFYTKKVVPKNPLYDNRFVKKHILTISYTIAIRHCNNCS